MPTGFRQGAGIKCEPLLPDGWASYSMTLGPPYAQGFPEILQVSPPLYFAAEDACRNTVTVVPKGLNSSSFAF